MFFLFLDLDITSEVIIDFAESSEFFLESRFLGLGLVSIFREFFVLFEDLELEFRDFLLQEIDLVFELVDELLVGIARLVEVRLGVMELFLLFGLEFLVLVVELVELLTLADRFAEVRISLFFLFTVLVIEFLSFLVKEVLEGIDFHLESAFVFLVLELEVLGILDMEGGEFFLELIDLVLLNEIIFSDFFFQESDFDAEVIAFMFEVEFLVFVLFNESLDLMVLDLDKVLKFTEFTFKCIDLALMEFADGPDLFIELGIDLQLLAVEFILEFFFKLLDSETKSVTVLVETDLFSFLVISGIIQLIVKFFYLHISILKGISEFSELFLVVLAILGVSTLKVFNFFRTFKEETSLSIFNLSIIFVSLKLE